MKKPLPAIDNSLPKFSEEVENRNNSHIQATLVALLILTTLLTLFTFRSLDDNRLISWLWVFSDYSVINFISTVSVGIIIAYALSRLTLSENTSVICLFISSYLVAAFFWRSPEVIIDASRYVIQAKQLELHGIGYFIKEWGKEIPAWTDLPLMPFLYGVIFSLFGENRIYIQTFNTLLFSGTVILTYLIGKKLWHKHIGLYAGALLLGMPYLIIQVPLMMVDIGTMFFLTLAIFTTIKAIESGKAAHCIFASVVIALAMLCKYSNWLMVSIMPVIALVYFQQGWKITARRGTVIALGVSLLMAIFLLVKYDLIIEQIQLLQDFQAPALLRWQESWISTFLFQIHPLLSLSILFSVVIALKNRDAKYLIISWLVILLFVLEIKRIRYSIAIFPMLAIMGAYGISALANIGTKKFVVSGIALSTILLSASATLPFLEKNSAINLKLAGKYLTSINAQNTEIFVLPQTNSSINTTIAVPMLDLFTESIIVYTDRSHDKTPQNLTKLPWRWTWEVANPPMLSMQDGIVSNRTIVVIKSSHAQKLPLYIERKLEGSHLIKEFRNSSNVFKYRTLVYIYQHI